MWYLHQIKRVWVKVKYKYLEGLTASNTWYAFANVRKYIYENIYKQPAIQDIINYTYRVMYRSKAGRKLVDDFFRFREITEHRVHALYFYAIFIALIIIVQLIVWIVGGWSIFFFIFFSISAYFVIWGNFTKWYKRFSLIGRKKRVYFRKFRRTKGQTYLLKRALRKKVILFKEDNRFLLHKEYPKRNWLVGKTKFQEYQYAVPKLLNWRHIINLLSPKTIFFFNDLSLILRHHISYYQKSFVIDPVAKTKEEQLALKSYLESDGKLDLIENELRAKSVIKGKGRLTIKPIYSKECLYDHRNNTQVILSCYVLVFTPFVESVLTIESVSGLNINNSVESSEAVLALGPWYADQVERKPWYVAVDVQVYREAIKANYQIGFDIDSHLTLMNKKKFRFGERGHYWIQSLPEEIKEGPFVRRPRIRPTKWDHFRRIWKFYANRRWEQFCRFVKKFASEYYYKKIYTRRVAYTIHFIKKMTKLRDEPIGSVRRRKFYLSKIRGNWEYFSTVYFSYVKRNWTRSKFYHKIHSRYHYWLQRWYIFSARVIIGTTWFYVTVRLWYLLQFRHPLLIWQTRWKYQYEPIWRKGLIRKKIKKYFKAWVAGTLLKLIPKFLKECLRLISVVLFQTPWLLKNLFTQVQKLIKGKKHLEQFNKKDLICNQNKLAMVKSELSKSNNFIPKVETFTIININYSEYIRKSEEQLKRLGFLERLNLDNAINSDIGFYEERLATELKTAFNLYETKGITYDQDVMWVLSEISRWPCINARIVARSKEDRLSLRHFVYLSELKKTSISPEVIDDMSHKLHGILQQRDFFYLIPNKSDYDALAMVYIDDLFFGLTQFYNEKNYTWTSSEKYLEDLFLYYNKWFTYVFVFYAQGKLKEFIDTEISTVVALNNHYIKSINKFKCNTKPIIGQKISVRVKSKVSSEITLVGRPNKKGMNYVQKKYLKEVYEKLILIVNSQ